MLYKRKHVEQMVIVLLGVLHEIHAEQLCKVDCTGEKERPVCGSNNKTYKSRCELQKELCQGLDIKVKHRGPCHEGVGSRCLAERRNAVRTSSESGIPIFVPACSKDGSYIEIQCHKGTGYCWCVTETGKPVPGSSVRYAQPQCRSPPDSARFRRGRGRRKMRKSTKGMRKGCTQADRTYFNSNLREMVATEHRTMFGSKGRPEGKILGNSEKEVMEWKFLQLDENRDGVLKKKELKQFKNDIKKVLRPRRCSRSFVRFCDFDSNRRISKYEWRSCVGLEENISFKLFLSLNSEEDEAKRREERERKRQHSSTLDILSRDTLRDQAVGSKSPLSSKPSSGREDVLRREEDRRSGGIREGKGNCPKEREEANTEARNGNEGAYVPECDANGKYNEVQCYKSTGYCWCVETTSGRPVPGTSTKDHRPNCSKPARKVWHKCEGLKRDQFLAQIKDWFRDQMSRGSTSLSSQYRDQSLSMVERSILWKFSVLDRNKDGILKKKEVRAFKSELRAVEGLKRCGKRINKYCDKNSDANISVDEWRDCFNQGEGPNDRSPINPLKRRRGPNPLKTWLKGD